MLTKSLVRTLYDMQHERIQTGNRICAEIKNRLGQRPGMSEKELEKEAQDYLKRARAEYKRITDAFVLNQAHKYLKVDFGDYEIITDAGMLVFVELYEEQLGHEEHMAKVIGKLVAQHPLWPAFLEHVRGCGPLMSAVILAEFDPHKARHVSSFWKYAGLDVAGDGRGRSRRSEHLVERDYIDKDGKAAKRQGVTFNPFLKTKMVGVLGSSFIKQPAEECKYRQVYDDYKHRLESHPLYGVQNDERRKAEAKAQKKKYAPVGHRHNMAIRYAVKMFLADLWLAWRLLEGLPVTPTYHEAVLGHTHGQDRKIA
ncbi:MAG: hypothetical protein QM570_15440 [Planctomycetota bacterium]|nr:hypothetical protein [Planctomycetota bacterium]